MTSPCREKLGGVKTEVVLHSHHQLGQRGTTAQAWGPEDDLEMTTEALGKGFQLQGWNLRHDGRNRGSSGELDEAGPTREKLQPLPKPLPQSPHGGELGAPLHTDDLCLKNSNPGLIHFSQ